MSAQEGLVLFLPETAGGDPHWMRVVGGQAVSQGQGTGWLHASGLVQLPSDCTVMLVPPAGGTALHWVSHPDMPPRQGRAAARISVLERSLALSDSLFAAADRNDDPDSAHIVAVTAREDMADWLLFAQHHGLDPDIVLPAPLLLPVPDDGFVGAALPDGSAVLRGAGLAMVDEPDLRAVLLNGASLQTVAPTADLAIAALSAPALNLRQGDFAKRAGPVVDAALLRRAAILIGFILLASLLISIVTIIRYTGATAALDAQSLELARKQVPGADTAEQAEAMLNARLIARGDPASAFSGRLAALLAAVRTTPDVTLTRLSRTADGGIAMTLSASGPETLNQTLIAMQQSGFTIDQPVTRQEAGKLAADIMVQAR